MHLTSVSSDRPTSTLAVDVGSVTLNLFSRDLSGPGAVAEWEIPNRTEAIQTKLSEIQCVARERGIAKLRVVFEPTGVYHRLLVRVARSLGFEISTVDPGHVTKMRSVLFGDDGKTDQRDPRAIEAVAERGRLIADRQSPQVYELLRSWGRLYVEAEKALIDAKSRIHRGLTLLFPDFSFTTDFLYSPSGRAIQRCFGFDPHAIAAQPLSRLHARLARHSNLRRSSSARLLTQALETIAAGPKSRIHEIFIEELAICWQDLELAESRRSRARGQLESLYDEARTLDEHLPDPVGSVISKVALARFLGETGPLGDYRSWRQLLRMGGVNLKERKSGKYVGQTKIARKGRPLIRAILNQMALPLVKRDRLYGPYYHFKTEVQNMPGAKAMTAVSRKLVKLIWGWYRSGAAFDPSRVFACASVHQQAA